MVDLSQTCIHALRLYVAEPYGYAADALPDGVDVATVEYLFALHLLDRFTVVPPGRETEFYGPCGLLGYRINEAGRERLRLEDQRIQELSDQAAQKEEEARANDAKMKIDRKKQFRHDFAVAAFSIALTLLVEHFENVVDFALLIVEKAMAMLQ